MGKENTYKHESQGMLQIAKVKSNKAESMFGSRVATTEAIRITLKQGVLERDLNYDKAYATGKALFELEMTPLQFAEMITSLNNGDGTPVTIRQFNGKEMQEPVYKTETEVFSSEFEREMKKLVSDLKGLTKKVYGRLEQTKPLNKAEKDEIKLGLEGIERFIGSNLPYMEKTFTENIERTVQEAKMMINATINRGTIGITTEQNKVIE